MGSDAFEVVIVGAGFGGLAMAHALKEAGVDNLVILERSDGVGGTWRQNTYPGAACDVPSHLYSLSFAPNPTWSRVFARQPEILAYVEGCYDRFDVRKDVRFGVEVVDAAWDEAAARWHVRDRSGTTISARVLVWATGTFHTPVEAALPGLADFTGPVFHSARWDHERSLAGARVAVVGTGASAIQIVPELAGDAAQIDVYQRTPAWILPRPDGPYSPEKQRTFADDPVAMLAHRTEWHDRLENAQTFVIGDPTAALIQAGALAYLDQAVADPALRAALTPSYPIGCKRVLISSDFYPAIQRDDVELVTAAIERVTATGIRAVDGTERPADAIVLATGFRAADYLHGITVRGRGGRDLHEQWAGTPRALHGMAVPGFPNQFLMYGPNTNQGGNSILLMLEAQATFITGAVRALRTDGVSALDVQHDAMAAYLDELTTAMKGTVWYDGCESYFRNAAGEVVTQLPHTTGWYAEQTATFPLADFRPDAG